MNPHIRKWTKIINKNHSPAAADRLIKQIEQRFIVLLAAQPSLPNRFLQAQWEQLIAPGLALYQTHLAEDGADPESVLNEVQALFRASFFRTERRLLRLLNLLPEPFPLVRLALRQMTANHYLPGASQVVEDSRDCFAANTTRCFILDTLSKYGAPELTPLYCMTDDWLAESLPKVRWLRTQTLANGGKLCDFCWCRR